MKQQSVVTDLLEWFCVQKNIKKRPWMALYTGAFGGLIGAVFFLISIWAKFIDRKHGGCAVLTAE